jgi:hypothetical protein
VEARILKVKKKAEVNAEIAKELRLSEEAVGRLGVAKVKIQVTKAGPSDACASMAGKSGQVVVCYELSNKDLKLKKGEVVQLHYSSFPGFPPYGVPGWEIWYVGEAAKPSLD